MISPPRDPRDNGVQPPALNIGEEAVVCVLKRDELGARAFSFHRLARIDATAGLQTSQPSPVPCSPSKPSNVLIFLILTI